MKRIAILFGGYSAEHDISIMSAQSIASAMDKTKYELVFVGFSRQGKPYLLHQIDGLTDQQIFTEAHQSSFSEIVEVLTSKVDVCFPIIHGPGGEDGKLQGFLSTLGVPYVGAGVFASAVCMDKWTTKKLIENAGVPTLPAIRIFKQSYVDNSQNAMNLVAENLSFPVFIKPCNMGSSIGITKVKIPSELAPALELAFKYDNSVLVEQGIVGKDIECAVIGNYKPQAMSVGAIIPNHEFYDFESKYTETAPSDLIIPADIDPELIKQVQALSLKAYQILGVTGMARVDFMLETATNKIYLNEINTLPGYTKYSMYSSLCADAGLNYNDMIAKLIDDALEVYAYEKNLYNH